MEIEDNDNGQEIQVVKDAPSGRTVDFVQVAPATDVADQATQLPCVSLPVEFRS